MPTDAELVFADHMARHCATHYGLPPMVGRLLGYLAVCDPPDPTIAELAEALLASRSAITNAVKAVEPMQSVRRSRRAGERMDRVRIDLTSPRALGLDMTEYEDLRALAREGLEVVRDAPPERRAVLLEVAAYADFVHEQVLRIRDEWEARRAELVAAGELPARPGPGG